MYLKLSNSIGTFTNSMFSVEHSLFKFKKRGNCMRTRVVRNYDHKINLI